MISQQSPHTYSKAQVFTTRIPSNLDIKRDEPHTVILHLHNLHQSDMAELPPPNPPPVPLPAQPQDPAVQLPIAPASPPTEQDVIRAVLYHHDVYTSFRM